MSGPNSASRQGRKVRCRVWLPVAACRLLETASTSGLFVGVSRIDPSWLVSAASHLCSVSSGMRTLGLLRISSNRFIFAILSISSFSIFAIIRFSGSMYLVRARYFSRYSCSSCGFSGLGTAPPGWPGVFNEPPGDWPIVERWATPPMCGLGDGIRAGEGIICPGCDGGPCAPGPTGDGTDGEGDWRRKLLGVTLRTAPPLPGYTFPPGIISGGLRTIAFAPIPTKLPCWPAPGPPAPPAPSIWLGPGPITPPPPAGPTTPPGPIATPGIHLIRSGARAHSASCCCCCMACCCSRVQQIGRLPSTAHLSAHGTARSYAHLAHHLWPGALRRKVLQRIDRIGHTATAPSSTTALLAAVASTVLLSLLCGRRCRCCRILLVFVLRV
uniref:Uncharacterized protein n=1 Tax=Anopheles coluzzii TaxID=1518534 RepID=A0A8W7P8F3_ANOCL